MGASLYGMRYPNETRALRTYFDGCMAFVLDLTLPGMDGRTVLERLVATRPAHRAGTAGD